MNLRKKHNSRRLERTECSKNFVPFFEELESRLVLSTMVISPSISQDLASAKTGPLSKIDTQLIRINRQFETTLSETGEFTALSNDLKNLAMTLGTKVGIQAASLGPLDELRADLAPLGFEETNWTDQVVAGWLETEFLDELAGLESLRFASVVLDPLTNVGAVDTEGDLAMNAPAARASLAPPGGNGVTVGVISNSFDFLTVNEAVDIGTLDLPAAGVTVLLDDLAPPGTPDEGRAMLQIVHDIAPGAALAFHSAFNSPGVLDQSIATAITNLAAGGADVIVDDVGILTAPFFQDAFAAQAVDTVVAMGIPYFSAAGNSNRLAYESGFRSSGVLAPSGGIFHDFDPGPGVDVTQAVTIPSGTGFTMSMQWDENYFSLNPGTGGSRSDLDVFVLDDFGNTVAASVTNNIGGNPFEFFGFTNTGVFGSNQFHIAITNVSGPDPGLIKYILFDTSTTIDEYDTASGTSFGHPIANGTESVAAAEFSQTPAFGVSPPVVETFSSAGTNQIFFDTAGNRLVSPESRLKPRITAPDGVSTTMAAFSPFFGTSAAAPHAAGVAALMLQAVSTATPAQIYSALEASAIDMDDPATTGFDFGFDFASGYGLIQADVALSTLIASSMQANEIVFVDVSQSMEAFYGDVNLDGAFDSLDDLNSDGMIGTVLDGAIQRVLDTETLMPTMVAVGIHGADATILDVSPAAGMQNTVDRTVDSNGDGVTDFHEVLFSLRTGQGGPFTLGTVDPTSSFYEPALDSIRALAGTLGAGTAASIYSDGAGRLPDPAVSDPLAGFPIVVDVEIIGPYQQIGSTVDIRRIATDTGGLIHSQISPAAPTTLSTASGGAPIFGSSAGMLNSFTQANQPTGGDDPSGEGSVADSGTNTDELDVVDGGIGTMDTSTERSRDHRSTGSDALSPESIDVALEDWDQNSMS